MIGTSRSPAGRRRVRRRRLTATTAAVGLVSGMFTWSATAAAAAPRRWEPVAPQITASVPGHVGTPAGRVAAAGPHAVHKATPFVAKAPTWPTGSGRTALSAKPEKAAPAKLTGLPVTLASADAAPGAASAAAVSFADRATTAAAGVDGVVFTVSRSDGGAQPSPVDISLDYTGFATASGGGYADRLTLVRLPACALTTPSVPSCRVGTPLGAANDTVSGTLSARVAVSATPMVVAATTTATGGVGDYSATSLSPEGSWSVGGNTGAFSYSYPITVPPSPGGAAPDVALHYNSASVDGRTSATNAQASWIGDGWDYAPGFVERSYLPCSKDGITGSDDMCWGGDELALSLDGTTNTLVRDDKTGDWHLESDAGSKVVALTGVANGSWKGEAWELITTDGTRYYFGQNHLPGGGGTDAASNSTWTQPVFCPKSGDGPAAGTCYDSAKGTKSSVPNMAWRWNLDYVVDPHGNLTSYAWAPETNDYEMGYVQNNGSGTLTPYTRGGTLASIGYGYSLSAAIGGAKPTATVTFGTAERCLPTSTFDCAPAKLTATTAPDWPDVPFDQICATGSTSCANYSTSYFSTRRLTSITTSVLVGPAYQTVDVYSLSQSFPAPEAGLVPQGKSISGSNPGDGSVAVMWLDQIQHTGKDTLGGGAATALPPTVFTADEMPNRVDGNTYGAAALYRPRIVEITTDAGAQTVIGYSTPQCSRTNNVMPASPDSNTMNCFPQYWTPNTTTKPGLDWFTTYQVTSVTVNDTVAPRAWSEASQTTYSYDGPAWHRDDSPLTPSDTRTWNQFRGFRTVTTTTGAASAQSTPTQEVATYLQGMDGDHLAGGATRSVTVPDSVGDTVTDSVWLGGALLEHDTLNGVGGTVLKKDVHGPWTFTQTASQAQANSMPALVARIMADTTDRSFVKWHDGSWEQAKTTTVYNATGQAVSKDLSYSGPSALPEVCTTTKYATNASAGMYAYPDEVTSVQGSCATTPSATVTLSDVLTYYDGSSTLGSLTGAGDATMTQATSSYTVAGAPVPVTSAKRQYDSYGRVTSETDGDGNTTKTAYSAPGTSPDTVTVTTPNGWVTTQTLDPGRDLTLSATDANTETTTTAYDGLGRATANWSPLHQSAGAPADSTFTYSVTGTAPTAVTTSVLHDDGSRGTSTALYDGLLRRIQTQSATADGEAGRLISDIHYDSLGQEVKNTSPYYDKTSGPTSAVFVPANDSAVPSEVESVYDGAGRQIQALTVAYGVNQFSTSTGYRGWDESDTTPPAGGSATSAFVDGAGRAAATWTYRTATATGNAADAVPISRAYTADGRLATITDAAGNTWTYHYNLLGQPVFTSDPGSGTSTSTFTVDGDELTSTDAAGNQLSYTYDQLHRKIAAYNTTGGAAKTAADQIGAWTYDTLAKGHLATATTYTDGASDAANTWTESITGYTAVYQPTGQSVVVPSSQGALAGTYQVANQYSAGISQLNGVHYYPEGGLPKEQLNIGRTATGLISSFGTPYAVLNSVSYAPDGQVLQTNFGAWGMQVSRTETYDPATRRLLSVSDGLQTLADPLQALNYTYNQSGRITAESDKQHGVAVADTQCFGYNALDELTAAWTDTAGVSSTTGSTTAQVQGIGSCLDSAPAAGKVTGGPAPYWQSYAYDLLGDRVSESSHDTTVTSNANTVTQTLAYNGYNAATGATTAASTPDAVQSVTTTGPSGTSTSAYGYYPNGATKSRAGQSFTYNVQGLVQSVTNTTTGSSSSYIYDADGTLLVQSDPAASQKLLYLPWGEQITLDTTSNTVSGLRTLPQSPDGISVVHSSTGSVSYELGTGNGTATAEVGAADLSYQLRYYDPFGQQRGATPGAWPDQRAYLDQPNDPTTGLDLLGARQYDPVTGRFLSVDPLLETNDQRQLNGYSYSADDPVDGSDPQGLMYLTDGGGCGCSGTRDGSSGEHSKGGGSTESGGVWHGSGSSGGGYSRTGFAPQSGGGYWRRNFTPGRPESHVKPPSPAALFGVKGSCSQSSWQAPCLTTRHREDDSTPIKGTPDPYCAGFYKLGCPQSPGDNLSAEWDAERYRVAGEHELESLRHGAEFFEQVSVVTGSGAFSFAVAATVEPEAEPFEQGLSEASTTTAGISAAFYWAAWARHGQDEDLMHAGKATLSMIIGIGMSGEEGGAARIAMAIAPAMAKPFANDVVKPMTGLIETGFHALFDGWKW